MRLKLFGATVLSLGILAGACANAPTGAGPGDGGTGSDGTGTPTPIGSDQLVLRIEEVGGFVAVQYNLTRMPMMSLYADGLLITPGVQTDIYPGPALPTLTQRQLSPEGVRLVTQAAIDAGLNSDRDLQTMLVSDMPTTVFTLTVDGQTYTTNVYALGMDLKRAPQGMSPQEFQARQDLAAFEKKATDLSWLPAGSVTDQGMYAPTGLQIYSGPYQPDPSLTEPPVAWPLTPGLDLFGDSQQGTPGGLRCGTAAGDDATMLMPLVEQANQLTPWTSDGSQYGLLFRPLLPDESGC
jgi:hypothetical protein